MKREKMQKQNLRKKEEERSLIPKLDLDTKKELAKIGMTATMGITVVTAFYMKNKTMKYLHIGAGAALVGFSYWHHMLYQPDKKKKSLKEKDNLSKESEAKTLDNSKNYAINLHKFYIEFSVKGKLTDEELKSFEDKIETLLEAYNIPSMNILVDIREITGIEAKALWDDFLFALRHFSDIKKVCVVGNKKFEEYSVKAADKILPVDMQYFEEYDKAHKWLLS
eukprot:Anaeramoba_flamelloidesa325723_423.p4 GENE.a325723_423~~a325723_423.p4  ORF type:complete len:223 (-),score=19.37 a325723_423:90-758(-)